MKERCASLESRVAELKQEKADNKEVRIAMLEPRKLMTRVATQQRQEKEYQEICANLKKECQALKKQQSSLSGKSRRAKKKLTRAKVLAFRTDELS